MTRDPRRVVPTLAVALLATGALAAPQAESPAGAPRAVRPAAAKRTLPGRAALPPLLDRELFFGNPEIAAAQISPDGKYIAFLKPWKDTRNVWVKKTGEGYDKARLVTADPKRPIPGFFWTRDSR